MFAHIRADLNAYQGRWWEQGFWVMLVYRFGRWRYGVRPALVRKPLSLLYKIAHKLAQIMTGIDLPCEVEVGRNFVIDHFGAIIISGYASFGDNCRIRNGVCVGLRYVDDPCAPIIGNNVDIGAGAKVLGPITIGDNVMIGANAVVITDVPADCIAVGVPATIRPRRTKPQADTVRRPRRWASNAATTTERTELAAARRGLAPETSGTPGA
jgi:serine O-acetyltransferase